MKITENKWIMIISYCTAMGLILPSKAKAVLFTKVKLVSVYCQFVFNSYWFQNMALLCQVDSEMF